MTVAPKKFVQLPLLPDTPGMEPPPAHVRRKPQSPGEHEMAEALLIRDPAAQQYNVARIELRNASFDVTYQAWRDLHRHVPDDPDIADWYDGCVRCDGAITEACLLYQGKAYCATCRNEMWAQMGKRVGLYR